ncbi:hypothetical protein J5N97_025483 [Dioscorea zingiberensis]|uniref:Uncharacterized protein n=1 Tax=Dioscorea zingiberensis TaxID=325984 RepID=A0A9D5H9M0_9LILI|nr:hypothetical protein J5N97_025483 [Dioscorea zingiberensis]
MSIQRYKARQYIANHYQDDHQNGCQDVLLELAKSEFNSVQLLHQRELKEVLSWWKNTRLAQDLSFVRDQPLKWYLWPLTVVPHPHLSMCRIELTKAIAFIYIIDDIFDVHGTLEELSLFTQAINKWDLSSIDVLPNYMKVCYNALYKITNEIADITLKEYGWNPINTLSKLWAKLCNAFLQEAKWFASGQVPNKDEYLRNAVISSGVFIVIVHLFFLMGNGLTKENVEHIEEDPSFISYTGTILRLWDDLGSAKDENQNGFDGSYMELYMKEHPQCSAKEAHDHVMLIISRTWETLNKESFSQTSFLRPLVRASVNLARMDELQIKHSKNISTVRDMFLISKEVSPLESVVIIDKLQQLGIDHLYVEEIGSTLSSIYDIYIHDHKHDDDLFQSTLFFRLFREHGYDVSPNMLNKFIDNKSGEFKLSSSKDIKGLLSLYEASHLNNGEEILRKAKEFSSKHLWDSIQWLETKYAKQVRQTLEHPYHMSIQRYKARQYIANHYQDDNQNGCQDVLLELAKSEFNSVQLLHQRELKEVLSWWKNIGLAQDLSFVRDQPLKWYVGSLTVVPHPHLSMCRIELTKAIAFIYIIDDIFDVHGTLEELSLFTQAINKWDLSAIEVLPNYMKICYNALYKITNEIADITLKEYGWNPINTLSKSWAKLFNAFLQEVKWFASGQVPNKDDYLRNAVISSGVFIVIVHLFFLMGNGLTKENVEQIEKDPSFIYHTGVILRLWDDLGSAKDENQNGFDGSYMELYMKEHPQCSAKEAHDHVILMISRAWETLNKESFSQTSFPQPLVRASLNLARMVRVMYSYDDDHHLPMLDDHVFSLLHHSL